MADLKAPAWARCLTDEDEWVVRTALANVAHDLERVAQSGGPVRAAHVLKESARRYRETLGRIELASE